MRQMTSDEREAFLAEPWVGVLSVASDDGRPPLTVPIWYGYQPGGYITFFTGTQGRKARKTRLIERAGVISVSVQHGEMPYRYVPLKEPSFRLTGHHPPNRCLPSSGAISPRIMHTALYPANVMLLRES